MSVRPTGLAIFTPKWWETQPGKSSAGFYLLQGSAMITTLFRAFLAAPMAFSSSNLPYAWNVECSRWRLNIAGGWGSQVIFEVLKGWTFDDFWCFFSTFRYMFGRVALSRLEMEMEDLSQKNVGTSLVLASLFSNKAFEASTTLLTKLNKIWIPRAAKGGEPPKKSSKTRWTKLLTTHVVVGASLRSNQSSRPGWCFFC